MPVRLIFMKRDREGSSEDPSREDPEVVEVEVERLDPKEDDEGASSRWGGTLGPVLAGMIIDVLDLATFGATGIYIGFLLGAPAGWYLARRLGLDPKRALLTAICCGVYCTIPLTSPIPVATLIGVWARAHQSA